MVETQAGDFINQLAGQVGVGGAVVLILWRLFSAYQKKSEQVLRLAQDKTDRSIRFLEEYQKKLSLELVGLRRKLDEMQSQHLKTQEHLIKSAENYHSMSEAFKGYVSEHEPRIQELETQQSELIKLGKELVLIRSRLKKVGES